MRMCYSNIHGTINVHAIKEYLFKRRKKFRVLFILMDQIINS